MFKSQHQHKMIVRYCITNYGVMLIKRLVCVILVSVCKTVWLFRNTCEFLVLGENGLPVIIV